MFFIGSYGYMLSTLQTLFLAIQIKDPKEDHEQSLDNWLINLGRCRKGVIPQSIIHGSRLINNFSFKWDPMLI